MMMVNNDNDVDVATGDASTIADIANITCFPSIQFVSSTDKGHSKNQLQCFFWSNCFCCRYV